MLEITNEFAKWPSRPERVSAVKYSPGWKGCSASHLKCITIAKERKYPWVLILEDDCVLTSTALEQFKALLPFLWNSTEDWDLFYGGTTFLKYGIRKSYSPPLFQVSGYAAHFCLIHKSSYNKILENHPQNIENFEIPIDVYYSDKFRIWTTLPFFAKQRPSISDIVITGDGLSVNVDYNSEFNKAESLLTNMIF
jgi:GR25 family glycosyltransferase involved in LPS biosynthesis